MHCRFSSFGSLILGQLLIKKESLVFLGQYMLFFSRTIPQNSALQECKTGRATGTACAGEACHDSLQTCCNFALPQFTALWMWTSDAIVEDVHKSRSNVTHSSMIQKSTSQKLFNWPHWPNLAQGPRL